MNNNSFSVKSLSLLFCLFMAISFILYANTVGGDFVYDDIVYITYRDDISDSGTLWRVWGESFLPTNYKVGLYRPLTMFTFVLNYIILGESPISFHVVNIALNGIITFLAFLVLYMLFSNKTIALFSGIFYAFLPIHTEVVANIKSRDEILSALFFMLAWLVFMRAIASPEPAKPLRGQNTISTDKVRMGYLAGSVSIFFLALLSKESAITAPFLFVCIMYFRDKRLKTGITADQFKKYFKLFWLFIPVILFYFSIRLSILKEYAFNDNTSYVLNPIRDADLWSRLATTGKIAFIYISKTFLPINLSADYSFNQIPIINSLFYSWEALLGWVILALLVYLVIKKSVSFSIKVGVLAFLIPYALISKVALVGGALMGERFMYLPSLGLAILAGCFLNYIWTKNRGLALILITIVLISYSIVAISRNKVWLSNLSIYSSMIESAPNSVQGYYLMGAYHFKNNDIEKSKEYVKEAFAIYKDYQPLLYLRARIAIAEKDYYIAQKTFSKALETSQNRDLIFGLAEAFYLDGKYSEALSVFKVIPDELYEGYKNSDYYREMYKRTFLHIQQSEL